MASNMPTLWLNSLEQFSSEIAKKAWVWFAETRGHGMQYAADEYAAEVDRLVSYLDPMLLDASIVHGAQRGTSGCGREVVDDLLRFILIRHANYRLGANVVPPFLLRAA